jgi:flagella basal body P-ring formation protein FlgA
MIAAKTLIPGRALTQDDMKPMPIVKRGQQVDLEYQKGNLKVAMVGRALLDGAEGDTIPVSVDMGKEKRYQGKILSNGSVQLEL